MVQSYINGDHRVEKTLYNQLRILIHNLIRAMEKKGCGFSDHDDVVAQIIFEIMVKDDKKVMQAYQGKSQLSTYLWPIVRNKIVDAIRKEKRYNARIDHEEITEQAENPHQEMNTIGTMIEEFIDNEPPLERFIKRAKWIQELSYNDIIQKAHETFNHDASINSQRIAYILHTNRKNLQKKLKKFGI